jgi:putative sterol carrier protein
MIENIFAQLPDLFQADSSASVKTYYFSLGDVKKTVRLAPDGCTVKDGKTVDQADCVCKTTPEFFTKIWEEGYRPGLKDFMSGTIKSNNPNDLKVFLAAFGKES